jgi:hypothetical protein
MLCLLCGFNLRRIFRIWILSFIALFVINVPPLHATELIPEVYDRALFEIYDLRTISAQRIIDEERDRDPGSLFPEYLENWKEVIELLSYSEEERYKAYLISLDARLERISENGDQSSPSYHILLGEIYSHAAMAQVMYGDYLAAFGNLLRAKKNANINVEKHPDYWLNNKLVGIMNVSFDKIPSMMRWFTNLFGLRGDAETGFKQMDQYLRDVQDYPGLKSEIVVYYVFGLKLSRNEEMANELFNREMDPDEAPVLALYLQASYLYMTGKNEDAFNMMFSFPSDHMEVPFGFVDFLRGKIKLNRLDQDADIYMLSFLEHSKFKNYKREISMKLAYHYFIQGDTNKYQYYKNQAASYPKATTNRDREADVERQRPYEPHPDILKARHLVNGEYFARANLEIGKVDVNKLDQQAYLVEYYLITAKIRSKLFHDDGAMALYERAIDLGRDRTEQYAAEAALFAGIEAQSKGDLQKANNYWELALEIDGQKDIYIEHIHDKATNLLERNEKGKHTPYQANMNSVIYE